MKAFTARLATKSMNRESNYQRAITPPLGALIDCYQLRSLSYVAPLRRSPGWGRLFNLGRPFSHLVCEFLPSGGCFSFQHGRGEGHLATTSLESRPRGDREPVMGRPRARSPPSLVCTLRASSRPPWPVGWGSCLRAFLTRPFAFTSELPWRGAPVVCLSLAAQSRPSPSSAPGMADGGQISRLFQENANMSHVLTILI